MLKPLLDSLGSEKEVIRASPLEALVLGLQPLMLFRYTTEQTDSLVWAAGFW